MKNTISLDNTGDVLTPEDLAQILPLHKQTIYKMLKRGEIHSINVGKRILIPKKFLLEFLESK